MTTLARCQTIDDLLRRLDDAVAVPDEESRCQDVKRVLSEALRSGDIKLDSRWLTPMEGAYARRLLHRDPAGRYSVLVMVWDLGQGTALHDHGGRWCVECVYSGQIEVTSYSICGGRADQGIVQFKEEEVVRAGVGQAGALIPPFEYHILRQSGETPAITLHVYGGELTHCHIYEPVEGGWRRRSKELCYTD
jgi:predicted metal-dependent enzyme (double-stranded beta helix superfamily)